jgi:hypothetical protein
MSGVWQDEQRVSSDAKGRPDADTNSNPPSSILPQRSRMARDDWHRANDVPRASSDIKKLSPFGHVSSIRCPKGSALSDSPPYPMLLQEFSPNHNQTASLAPPSAQVCEIAAAETTPLTRAGVGGDSRAVLGMPWSDDSSYASGSSPYSGCSPSRLTAVPSPPRLQLSSAPELIRHMWDFWVSAGLEDAPESCSSERVLIVTSRGTPCYGSELADPHFALQVCPLKFSSLPCYCTTWVIHPNAMQCSTRMLACCKDTGATFLCCRF